METKLIFSILLLIEFSKSVFPCEHLCDCRKIGQNYYCPNEINPKFRIELKNFTKFTLECYDNNFDYNSLPNLRNQRKIDEITIKNCPLPKENFVKNIFQPMNLTTIGNHLQFTLISNNFRNFGKTYFLGFETNLNGLRIDLKNLHEFDENTFSQMSNLRFLHLNLENIELKMEFFKNLKNLGSLIIENMKIERINRNMFEDLINLFEIDFRKNRIESIDNNTFSIWKHPQIANLREIKFDYNSISELPDYLFANLFTLREIHLNNLKNLTKIGEHIFENCRSLQTISIENTSLTQIPPNLFKNLHELIVLKFNNNPITQIPDYSFARLLHLDEIYLNHLKLEYVPENIFDDSRELRIISIEHNNLKTIPQKLFSLTNRLVELSLDYNPITELPDYVFRNLHRLQTINLNHLKLRSVPEHIFENSIRIGTISMEHNNLEKLPRNLFKGLKDLGELKLSNNSLTEFDLFILQENIILKFIYLNYNRLENLSLNVFRNPNYFGIRKGHVTIDLQHNQFKCDCNIVDIVQYATKRLNDLILKAVSINTDNVICAEPPHLKNKLIKDLRPIDIC